MCLYYCTIDVIFSTDVMYIILQATLRDIDVNSYEHTLQQNLGCNIVDVIQAFFYFEVPTLHFVQFIIQTNECTNIYMYVIHLMFCIKTVTCLLHACNNISHFAV